MIENLLKKLLFAISIKWGLMYLRSKQEYMGANWMKRHL